MEALFNLSETLRHSGLLREVVVADDQDVFEWCKAETKVWAFRIAKISAVALTVTLLIDNYAPAMPRTLRFLAVVLNQNMRVFVVAEMLHLIVLLTSVVSSGRPHIPTGWGMTFIYLSVVQLLGTGLDFGP